MVMDNDGPHDGVGLVDCDTDTGPDTNYTFSPSSGSSHIPASTPSTPSFYLSPNSSNTSNGGSLAKLHRKNQRSVEVCADNTCSDDLNNNLSDDNTFDPCDMDNSHNNPGLVVNTVFHFDVSCNSDNDLDSPVPTEYEESDQDTDEDTNDNTDNDEDDELYVPTYDFPQMSNQNENIEQPQNSKSQSLNINVNNTETDDNIGKCSLSPMASIPIDISNDIDQNSVDPKTSQSPSSPSCDNSHHDDCVNSHHDHNTYNSHENDEDLEDCDSNDNAEVEECLDISINFCNCHYTHQHTHIEKPFFVGNEQSSEYIHGNGGNDVNSQNCTNGTCFDGNTLSHSDTTNIGIKFNENAPYDKYRNSRTKYPFSPNSENIRLHPSKCYYFDSHLHRPVDDEDELSLTSDWDYSDDDDNLELLDRLHSHDMDETYNIENCHMVLSRISEFDVDRMTEHNTFSNTNGSRRRLLHPYACHARPSNARDSSSLPRSSIPVPSSKSNSGSNSYNSHYSSPCGDYDEIIVREKVAVKSRLVEGPSPPLPEALLNRVWKWVNLYRGNKKKPSSYYYSSSLNTHMHDECHHCHRTLADNNENNENNENDENDGNKTDTNGVSVGVDGDSENNVNYQRNTNNSFHNTHLHSHPHSHSHSHLHSHSHPHSHFSLDPKDPSFHTNTIIDKPYMCAACILPHRHYSYTNKKKRNKRNGKKSNTPEIPKRRFFPLFIQSGNTVKIRTRPPPFPYENGGNEHLLKKLAKKRQNKLQNMDGVEVGVGKLDLNRLSINNNLDNTANTNSHDSVLEFEPSEFYPQNDFYHHTTSSNSNYLHSPPNSRVSMDFDDPYRNSHTLSTDSLSHLSSPPSVIHNSPHNTDDLVVSPVSPSRSLSISQQGETTLIIPRKSILRCRLPLPRQPIRRQDFDDSHCENSQFSGYYPCDYPAMALDITHNIKYPIKTDPRDVSQLRIRFNTNVTVLELPVQKSHGFFASLGRLFGCVSTNMEFDNECVELYTQNINIERKSY